MKTVLAIFGILIINFSVLAQSKSEKKDDKAAQVVEASCGQCQFGLTDKQGCDLAVRIDGKSYWLDGTNIHGHGDAHGAGGFCTTVRKAEVVGEIKDGRYKASSFKLLPIEKPKDKHHGHSHGGHGHEGHNH